MNPMKPLFRWLAHASCVVALAVPAAAVQAGDVDYFVPFNGAGNLSDFTAGAGGWVGSIEQTPPPDVSSPLSLVSFVLFQLNGSALTGTFEFTSSNDLASTLFGTVTGTADSADILTAGGQFSLDYSILGGTGLFGDAIGFGLAFVDYDPAGSFNNYGESGALVFSVPEPATWALAACGLLVVLGRRRHQQGGQVSR